MAGQHVISDALPTDILDEYEVKETLGSGHFAKVKLGIHKATGQQVAIKIIQKPTGDKIKMLKAEVDILLKCDHPNIVKMYKCFETDKILYLVLELLTGGELFDSIVAKGHYSEAEAKKCTITMLEAFRYLHSMGIAHRDLKPENILLKDKKSMEIKISDFGLGKIFYDDAAGEINMKTACGTPGYVAPEVLSRDAYSQQVDLWSIGVIVYILLCGFPPFYGDNDNQMFKRIKAGKYQFLSPYWDPISKEAKDFVANLLIVDPKKRMTAAEALQHKWLGRRATVSGDNLFQAAGAPPDISDYKPSGESAEATLDGPKGTVGTNLTQFVVERKAGKKEKLIKMFNLPPDTMRLRKEMASWGNAFGQLHVTNGHICFVGSLGKKACVPIAEVTELTKAKRFGLSMGNGHSLFVTVKGGTKYEFHGIAKRDECLKSIQALCSAAGAAPTLVDKTK